MSTILLAAVPVGVILGYGAIAAQDWFERRQVEARRRRDFESGAFHKALDDALNGEPPECRELMALWAAEVRRTEEEWYRKRFGELRCPRNK